jgi:hypothetical protein
VSAGRKRRSIEDQAGRGDDDRLLDAVRKVDSIVGDALGGEVVARL